MSGKIAELGGRLARLRARHGASERFAASVLALNFARQLGATRDSRVLELVEHLVNWVTGDALPLLRGTVVYLEQGGEIRGPIKISQAGLVVQGRRSAYPCSLSGLREAAQRAPLASKPPYCERLGVEGSTLLLVRPPS